MPMYPDFTNRGGQIGVSRSSAVAQNRECVTGALTGVLNISHRVVIASVKQCITYWWSLLQFKYITYWWPLLRFELNYILEAIA